jgi:hypothetical protein
MKAIVFQLALVLAAASACDAAVGVPSLDEEDAAWMFDPANPETTEVEDPVVGLALAFPDRWEVVRDPVLFATHGFVLTERAEDDHGLVPVARLAIDVEGGAGDLAQRIDDLRAEFPDVDLAEWPVEVGGVAATAIGPIPGGQPSVAVFTAVDGALYRMNYYAEELDARGGAMLSQVRFRPREATPLDLGLEPADSPHALFGRDAPIEGEIRGESLADALAPAAAWSEYPLSNGCWAQGSGLFLQTTHSRDANGSGWSQMGTPNFWGERTHGNWGLGRCYSNYYTNDLYAIDYYLRVGDRLYSPLADGYVTYAGWDPNSWWNYGRMVVIESPNGKYVSLSAHMSHVNVVPGQRVNRNTLIGWAGSTGYAAPYPHVHQAYYRWPSFSAGRPYGGRGMMPTRLVYLGHGGGAYTSFWKGRWASW